MRTSAIHSKWLRLLFFAGCYLLTSRVFVLADRHWPIGEAIWPYTGIGLVGVLFFGFRIWPLIAVLNFVLQLSVYSPKLAATQALSEVLEVCVAAWLLQWARFDHSLQKLRDALVLMLVGAAAGSWIGSGLKQLFLLLFGIHSPQEFLQNWLGWWRGDALGVLIFTPILLIWLLPPQDKRRRDFRTEALLLLGLTSLLCFAILRSPSMEITSHTPLIDIFFLLVFWAAMRFGVRGAVSLSGLAAFVATIDTLHQLGNAGANQVDKALLELWAFLSVLSGSALLMATAIMERQRASERNRLLAEILEATPDFVGIARPNGEVFFLNRSAKALLGGNFPAEKIKVANFHPSDTLPRVFDEIIPAATRDGIWSGESVFLREGKQKIPVSQVVVAHKSADGELEFLSTIARDLSERKAVEDALRAAAAGVSEGSGQDFFQLLVQHLALALRVKYVMAGTVRPDRKDTVETLAIFSDGALQSNAEYKLAGTPFEHVMGHQSCYYPSGLAALFPDDEMLQSGGFDSYLGIPLFSSTGETIGLLAVFGSKPLESVTLANSILQIYGTRAATELERLRQEESQRISEQKVRQAQKIQAIGNLAGGIAHDFNNILTVIKGCTRLALNAISPESAACVDLREVQKATERASALTSHLLAFSRQSMDRPRSFDINAHILEVARMLGRMLGEDVELKTELAPDAGAIVLDPSEFDQIVMNLALNARDAMPNGGRIEFKTRKICIDGTFAQSLSLLAGEYVLFEVGDNGIGIDAESLRLIFEPFYTTKPVGKGTGLGLSNVYSIVHEAKGHISVQSQLGKGATFRLYFPSSGFAAVQQGLPVSPVKIGNLETLLLVEDEPALRNLAQRVLDSAGYRVLKAAGVEEAERILQEFSGRIDLLITDVVMPDGDSQELARKLEKLRPGTKVLYMSGYTDGRVAAEYLKGGHPSFLAKPFEPEQLTSKVRDLLDSAPVPASGNGI